MDDQSSGGIDPSLYLEIAELAKVLSDEEFAFCEEYLKDLSRPLDLVVASSCYNSTDYKQTVIDLLSNPNVIDYLNLRKSFIRQAFITRDDILLYMKQVLARCMQGEPVLDSRGQPTGSYKLDTNGAAKILKMLADYHGMGEKTGAQTQVVMPIPKAVIGEEELESFLGRFNEEY